MSEAPSGEVPDVEEIQGSVSSAWDTFVEGLPRAGIALVVLALAILLGRLLRPFVLRRLSRYRSPSFARVFAKLTSSLITTLGVLLGLTILFPSVKPVDVLAGAGVATIAAGIAFQKVLGNFLAGILLLFRQPFRGGDQVAIGDVTGTVVEINIRETVIRTYDGRQVLIPNDTVYSEVITVQTAHPQVRVAVDVGVAYEADLDRARRLAVRAAGSVPGVSDDPAPEVLVTALGESAVELQVLAWCRADQLQALRTADGVLRAVKASFDEAGIEMPAAIIALQATTSFATAVQGGQVTPGGAPAKEAP